MKAWEWPAEPDLSKTPAPCRGCGVPVVHDVAGRPFEPSWFVIGGVTIGGAAWPHRCKLWRRLLWWLRW